MAVTSVTTAMAGAINYTVVTDTSADWPSVANSTYFYDKADKLVHYKDSTGTVQEIFSGSGLTVGTTPVTSGTDTRVFFQAGGVVQQDANFTFDNTLKRLTLKAVGTAATDIPLLIRNSADTLNFLEIRGDNQFLFTNNSSGITLPFTVRSTDNNSAPCIKAISNGDISEASLTATRTGGLGVPATGINRGFLQLSNSGGNINVLSSNGGFAFSAQPVSGYNPTSDQMRLISGNLSIGTGYTGTARLDVRAQGALSTDIAFRVRNSADSANFFAVQGNGDSLFGNPTHGLLVNNQTLGNSKLDIYTYATLSTSISPSVSYFGSNGLSPNKGIAIGYSATTLAAPLDVIDVGFPTVGKSVARFGNFVNDLSGDNFNLLFSTRYSGVSGGNHLAKLTVGQTGSGASLNAKSYFKFELIRNNTLAERASITSQSNLLLQTPTEDTNDVGVIYIPNGTAPTAILAGGGKLYVEGGALKYIGSAGTITTIGPA